MSNGSKSLVLTAPGRWQPSNEYGSTSSNFEDPWNGHVRVPRVISYQTDEGGGTYAPWRIFEERVRTGPYGLSRFPSQPYSPIRVLVLDSDEAAMNPRLRRFIQESPPRIRGEWQLSLPAPEQEDPGLTEEEFKMAMKKMKKQVYNPVYPRRRYWRRGLFSNWNSNSNTDSNAADDEGRSTEGKDCAICLESFVPNEQVLLTPCNHMFHDDCLVPWVKSHGKCPVCRSMFYEKKISPSFSHTRNSNVSNSNNNNSREIHSGARGGEDVAVDLLYLIRAMEEAYNWVNLTR